MDVPMHCVSPLICLRIERLAMSMPSELLNNPAMAAGEIARVQTRTTRLCNPFGYWRRGL